MEEYEASPRASKRRRTGTYGARRTTLDTPDPLDSTTPRSQSSRKNGDTIDEAKSATSKADQDDTVPLEQTEDLPESVETTSRRSSTRKRKPTERAAQAEEDATPIRVEKPSRGNVKLGEDGSSAKTTKRAKDIASNRTQRNEKDDIETQPRSGRKASRPLASGKTSTEKESNPRTAQKGKASGSAVDGIESAVQSPQPKGILTPSRHGRTKKTAARKSVVFDADEQQIEAQFGFKDIDNSSKSKDASKTRRSSKEAAESQQTTPSRKRNTPSHAEPAHSDSDDDLDVPDIQTAPDVDEILSLNTAGADMDIDKRTLSYHQDNEHVVAIKGEILRRITNNSLPPICHLQTQYSTLHSLLSATITAGESNSLLLLGSRGSGKSLLVSHALTDLTRSYADDFHVVKLDGFFQTDDKLALREIWRQLGREMAVPEEEAGEVSSYADTMASLLSLLSHPEELAEPEVDAMDIDMHNHNHNHDSAVLKTTKSIIFIMDEFDLFTTHPRQTLLYNLFDIAQAKKAPIAVIGCSTRMDVVDCLEKRVKSRFSHRWLHVPSAKSLSAFEETVSSILLMPVAGKEALGVGKEELVWRERWNHVITVSDPNETGESG